MDDIYLSVIIPVYNTEKYFEKCLDSVIEAISKINCKSEIIVIDDGSTGNIKELIKPYLQKHSPIITFISQENKGRGATRNLGVSRARGKYISFIDSDDYIDTDMYSSMLEVISSEKADIAVCDIENIDYKNSSNNFIIETKNKNIHDDKWGCFDMMIMPSCCNKIFEKSLFSGVSFPEDINYEDLSVIPYIMLKAKKVVYVPKALYKYVQNENSVMNEKYGVSQLNIINALEAVFEIIDKAHDISSEDKEKAKYMIATRRYYEELLEKIMLSDSKEELIKIFCKKVKNLEEKLYNNIYFSKQIMLGGWKKRLGNRLLHKAIQRGNLNVLRLCLSKRLYYKFFAIKYSSENCY